MISQDAEPNARNKSHVVSCVISQDAEPNARNKSYPLSRVISQDADPNARTKSYPCLVCDITRHRTQCPKQIVPPLSCNKSYFLALALGYSFEPQTPATNRTSLHLGTISSPRHRQQIVFLSTWVLARASVLCVISQDAEPNARNKSYPLSVCDITRHRTQCPNQIVHLVSSVKSQDAEPNARNKSYPPVSCVISQDTEPKARNKSYPLSRGTNRTSWH